MTVLTKNIQSHPFPLHLYSDKYGVKFQTRQQKSSLIFCISLHYYSPTSGLKFRRKLKELIILLVFSIPPLILREKYNPPENQKPKLSF